jgi:hypothetical protein
MVVKVRWRQRRMMARWILVLESFSTSFEVLMDVSCIEVSALEFLCKLRPGALEPAFIAREIPNVFGVFRCIGKNLLSSLSSRVMPCLVLLSSFSALALSWPSWSLGKGETQVGGEVHPRLQLCVGFVEKLFVSLRRRPFNGLDDFKETD